MYVILSNANAVVLMYAIEELVCSFSGSGKYLFVGWL